MIFYTNRFIPKEHAACVLIPLVPIILIRPEYRNDEGLLAHEQAHVAQAWECVFPPLHGILYRFSRDYRLRCEVEAFRVQLQVNRREGKADFTEFYASLLVENYNLGITKSEALGLLRG